MSVSGARLSPPAPARQAEPTRDVPHLEPPAARKRSGWRWALLALAVVLAAWILRATVFAPAPVPVRAAIVERGLVESTLTNSRAGTVEARRRAKLSTGTSGIVTELLAHRGDSVAAGDVLLRLEDDTQRLALGLAERDLDVARARLAESRLAAERAQRELERNRVLARDGILSADGLDAFESAETLAAAARAVAEAQERRAVAAIEAARAELAKTVLHAPFDATVAEVSVELGEWVTPSVALLAAPELIDAIDPSSLYVSAPMDEVDAGRLAVGQRARVSIDSHPGQSFPGRVARVAPYVLDLEQQNRTIEIEVELDDAELAAALLPGTSADVVVVLDAAQDVLRIPSFCLLEGRRVLALERGALVERTVEIGMRNWDWAEITAGLREGELVVTSLERAEVRAGARAVLDGPEQRDGR